jgi:DNA polymerase III subunit epsilon
MGWHRELLIGFDCETTGTDPSRARIVTAAITEVADGEPIRRRSWLIDPGVPIPDDAAGIHGVTTEAARTAGRPPREAVAEIAAVLTGHWADGVPVVAYNAPFDLTLLAAELARHGLPPLPAAAGPVIDPLIVDRALDPDRRGKRTLEAVCAEYGVVLGRAHEAFADALAAVRVAHALAERYPRIARTTPWELHHAQTAWYARWAAAHQARLRREGSPEAVVEGVWPLREVLGAAG